MTLHISNRAETQLSTMKSAGFLPRYFLQKTRFSSSARSLSGGPDQVRLSKQAPAKMPAVSVHHMKFTWQCTLRHFMTMLLFFISAFHRAIKLTLCLSLVQLRSCELVICRNSGWFLLHVTCCERSCLLMITEPGRLRPQ